MGGRWPKQARHTSQMDRLCMRGEELAVEAPARPSGRDGVMVSPPPRRRWLLEGAGAAFQHVLTASTVTHDQAEHCLIRLRAWADSQVIGGGPTTFASNLNKYNDQPLHFTAINQLFSPKLAQ
jgi:predicted exporter